MQDVDQRHLLTEEPGIGAPVIDRTEPLPTWEDDDVYYVATDLRKEERAIALQFIGNARMWPYALAAFGCFGLWLSFFPLAIMGYLNLPLAFILSCFFVAGGYVTSHEGMHSNIGRKGEKWRWLNEAVGAVSTLPMGLPYSMARLMHLEHHFHPNDPLRDPDYTDEAPNAWMAWYKTWYNRQPGVDGSAHHYKRIAAELGTPEAKKALRETIIWQLVYFAVLFGMAWSGHAIAVALIWWLPRHIGLSWVRFYLSYAPHHPRAGRTGRYELANIWKSRVGNIMSMGMQYHLVHHLYPSIPMHRQAVAYKALKPILRARGVDVSAL